MTLGGQAAAAATVVAEPGGVLTISISSSESEEIAGFFEMLAEFYFYN